MKTITANDIEEVYRVECGCGFMSGDVDNRQDADEVALAHHKTCRKTTEVTTGNIPGYA